MASRLSRAALFALGASAAAVAACSSSSTGSSLPAEDSGADADHGQMQTIYGGPPFDASVDSPVLLDAAYGGPPHDAADAATD
jgi:hypothetical protein